MRKRTVNSLVFFLLLFVLTTPAFPGQSPTPVFVSILPQKYFVERIGGESVKVSVMVGPGQSPATYEPTPKQMERLSYARLYFSIGVPFEKIWMKRLAQNNPEMRIVETHRGIKLIPMTAHKQDEDAHNHEHEKEGKKFLDPHIWTSPPLVKIMAGNILKALTQQMPSHEQEFATNYRSFVHDLDLLTAEIHRTLKPVQNREFLVFHPSWGYFANTFGLKQVAIESEGKEPGPRSLVNLIQIARKRNIRVIFTQQQFSRTAAETVARAINGRVEAVDPLAENYLENMRQVTKVFEKAMKP